MSECCGPGHLPSLRDGGLSDLQVNWLVESGIDFLWGKSFTSKKPASQTISPVPQVNVSSESNKAIDSEDVVGGSLAALNEKTQQTLVVTPDEKKAINFGSLELKKKLPVPGETNTAEDIQQNILQLPQTLTPENGEVLDQIIKKQIMEQLRVDARQVIVGSGDKKASYFFVDVMPSYQDELEGEPLKGKGGILFDQMLKAMGCSREGVYVSPLIKSRTLSGHLPDAVTLSSYRQCLLMQIQKVRPNHVILMGLAAGLVLKVDKPIQQLRGLWYDLTLPDGSIVRAIATYHPSFLVVNPEAKPLVWQDLCRLLAQSS